MYCNRFTISRFTYVKHLSMSIRQDKLILSFLSTTNTLKYTTKSQEMCGN